MLADLFSESYETDLDEVWENERTATPVRAFAVRLPQTGCSLREATTILAELGVERSHGTVWNWVHRLADSGRDPPTSTRALLSCAAHQNVERSADGESSRVAVNETAVTINGE
ncbi:transposase [Natrinema gari JCM 14663]|uniref:Transposase n=1 Tax=Natrinema gari JCM 14663 TaxID=1230459 RepID=L9ZC31_9EURY|nr:transposase [Natrinema gari JCM 14663]